MKNEIKWPDMFLSVLRLSANTLLRESMFDGFPKTEPLLNHMVIMGYVRENDSGDFFRTAKIPAGF